MVVADPKREDGEKSERQVVWGKEMRGRRALGCKSIVLRRDRG